jgi:hypothetical protein
MLQQIISYITDVLFKTGNHFVRIIPVNKVQESCLLNKMAVLLYSRQACIDIAKYLYRPVARNGILLCSR